jgi:reactive chlorine resistance protein C
MTKSASMSAACAAQRAALLASTEPSARVSAGPLITPRLQHIAEHAAGQILRYGVVALLLYYGAFKFTAIEAEAIQPLVANSPFMAWLYELVSVRTVSNVIGVSELVVALSMASRSFAPRVCAYGSLAGVLTFLITLSFLVSTPGIWLSVPGFPLPLPNELGAFVLKDLLLLGGAAWSYAEAAGAAQLLRSAPSPD